MTTSGRRPRIALAVLAVSAVAVARTAFPNPAPANPAAAVAARAASTHAGVLGSAGCSAAGCHGGPLPAQGVSSPSAATLWLAHDPHARAFDSLRGEAAGKIARRLETTIPPDRDPQCLACHSNPAAVLTAADTLDESPPAVAARREGVGCESCHGAAEKWVVPHATWAAPPDRPGAYRGHGMAWLNDLTVRARVCAGCHVGAPGDARAHVPPRDVTHDMLAAGHPPLAFEFGSYTLALPPHWPEIDRARPPPNARGPEHATRAWLVGQLVAGEAALRLFADGAGRADPKAVWPEFARLDCAGCHRAIDPARLADAGPPERLGLDRWNVSHPLRLFARREPALADRLAALDAWRRTPRTALKENGRAAADHLAGWVERVKDDATLDAWGREAVGGLRAEGLPAAPGWAAAAHCVLALEAQARGEPGPAAAAFGSALAAVRARVRFPAGHAGPGHFVGAHRRDVAAELNRLLRALP